MEVVYRIKDSNNVIGYVLKDDIGEVGYVPIDRIREHKV